MPLYDFECPEGHRFELGVPLRDFDLPVNCTCGARASRVISAPMFNVDRTGYECPVTGAWIGSRRQHEENLKRTDCRVLEPGETRAAIESRKAYNEAFDNSVAETAEKLVEAMPSAKKETLYNELTRGAAVEYQRGAVE